jgi:NADH-quinone oxidoreductase subunit L
MIGPTPVSALLHSATMVAAGAYLLIRLYPLFSAAPGMLTVVAVIGGVTALFAALVATGLYDFKGILAWSTISHLGKMMFSVGLAGPIGAAYHLGTHACFKSTLFLTAGAVEHGTGTRDIRQLGGLTRMMPLTASVTLLAAITLAGVPPFSGFWSEDLILGAALSKGPVVGGFMVLLVLLSALYIGRAVMAVVGEWPGSGLPDAEKPYRSMGIAMLILGVAALFVGLLLHGNMEKIVPYGSKHSIPLVWKVLAGLAAVAGLIVGAWRVKAEGPVPAMGWFPRKMSDGLYRVTHLPVAGTMILSRFLDRVETGLDRGATGIAGGVLSTASGSGRVEAGLDRGAASIAGGVLATASGSRRVERGLDAGAKGLGRATFGTAYASDRAEHRGFSDGLDAFGRSLAFAGRRLKAYQSGLLYHYTLGLTIWVVVMGAVGLVVLVML